jgi:hypothetical protein
MAVDRVRQMGNLQTPMVLRVAATLRLPDLIADGVTTAGALAERTRTDRDTLARLLRCIAFLGLLAPDGEGYRLTELGEALRSTHPAGLARSLDANEPVGRIDLAHVRLLDAVRTGRAAYPLVHGRGFWEELAADPELTARFDRHMSSGDVAPRGCRVRLVRRRTRGRRGRRQRPAAGGHPPGCPAGAGHAGGAAGGGRGRAATLRGGRPVRSHGRRRPDVLRPAAAGADAYVLASLLHDWGDAEAEAIMRRCAEAAGTAGRVLVFSGVRTAPATRPRTPASTSSCSSASAVGSKRSASCRRSARAQT